MKTRLISALIGLAILFAALLLFETIVPNIAISLIVTLGVWELLHATGCTKSKTLTVAALLFSAIVPFFTTNLMMRLFVPICSVYVFVLFLLLLSKHDKVHIGQISTAFMFSLLVPFSLTTLLYMRDRLGGPLGIFYVLVVFGSAWLSDSCAYFAGRAFGKHKLAPVISPKKTVEGFIGGIVGGTITMILLLWGYSLLLGALGISMTVYYGRLFACIPIFSVVSVVGDLSASIIKRQFNVKDYGSIMPGHGGIMDRFDSALMVAPLVFMVCHYWPLALLG